MKMRGTLGGPLACLFLLGLLTGCTSFPTVHPVAETEPVASLDDAADDAAIWVNPANPEASLIIGTDKRNGLHIYNLDGEEQQRLSIGRLNNVDLRASQTFEGFQWVAAASNRSTQSISLFGITDEGELHWLEAEEIATSLADPYGLCMYRNGELLEVFINDKDGRYQQWRILAGGQSTLLREFRVKDQPEGCVADDDQHLLFFGIEDHGVYSMPANHKQAAEPLEIAAIDGAVLKDDVEGMDIYAEGNAGYLVVSSQGNNSYALFDRRSPHQYRGSVAIGHNSAKGIDGTSDTDGIAVTSAHLGERFPRGILVAQDGSNTAPRAPQNFKIVDWNSVRELLELP